MGLLDDAIREHLELKRRHGAAEEEVRQQEQEALGPPRRGDVPEPLAPSAGGEAGIEDEPEVEDAAQAPEFEPSEPLPPETTGEPDPPPEDRPATYAAPR